MPDLTVVAANVKNSRAAVRWLRRRSSQGVRDYYDLAGVYEAHKRYRMLRQTPGANYRSGDLSGPSRETGILVGRHLTELGHGAEFISAAIEKFESVGKERWGQDAVIGVGDVEVAGIVYHPVAGEKLSTATPPPRLLAAYAEATRWLDAKVDYHQARGREVVVMADCQLRESADVLWSPKHVFENHNMRWVWDGIDVIAYTNGLELVGHPVTRVRHGVLPDHPLLKCQFDLRTKRRNR